MLKFIYIQYVDYIVIGCLSIKNKIKKKLLCILIQAFRQVKQLKWKPFSLVIWTLKTTLRGMFHFIILQILWECYFWMFPKPSLDEFYICANVNVNGPAVNGYSMNISENCLFITLKEPFQNIAQNSENVDQWTLKVLSHHDKAKWQNVASTRLWVFKLWLTVS